MSRGSAEMNANEGHQPRLNEVAQKFIADLEIERSKLSDEFPLCKFLIEAAVDRIHATGRIPSKEFYADVYQQKPIKITQKVFVPIRQYPKFNFVGKLLGPKGHSLRRLEDETQCRITIKGRNSMRDRVKEEELRNSNNLRYAHLNKDLYVEVSTLATPAESYARIAYALAEIRKYLVPDKNDEVSHDQLREMMEIDPSLTMKSSSHMSYLSKYQPTRKYPYNSEQRYSPSVESRYIKMVRSSHEQDDEDPDDYQQIDEEVDEERNYEEVDDEDDGIAVQQKQRYMPSSKHHQQSQRRETQGRAKVKSSLTPSGKFFNSSVNAGSYKRPKVPVIENQAKRLRIAPPQPPKISKSYGMKH